MISYTYGDWDILRAKDLKELDKKIQLSNENKSKYFGVGIYDNNLCQVLGIDTPLKSLEDRMKIMEQIRGVDFVFPVHSLDANLLKDDIMNAYADYIKRINQKEKQEAKKYKIGYAPGTYDLFHAGHLENLIIAASQCEKLIIGVKSDELVFEHKKRKPILFADERIEILRHFKFTHDVYPYYTRDLTVAADWIKAKYNQEVQAIFLGSDLQEDFSTTKGLNIVYTPRDAEKMRKKSTTAYRKLYLSKEGKRAYTGNILEDTNKQTIQTQTVKLEKDDEHEFD